MVKARRHVTQAQLAMATTAVYAWAPAGKPKLHTECAVKTTGEMADIAGVHRNTIVQAQTVQAISSWSLARCWLAASHAAPPSFAEPMALTASSKVSRAAAKIVSAAVRRMHSTL